MFCSQCGTKTVDGGCATCTSKSTSGLSFDSLEKSLAALEDVSKGVRPGPAKAGENDRRTQKELVEDVIELVKKYGAHGEGDTEEQPKTTKGVESVTKKGAFGGPAVAAQEDEDEDEEEREREQAAAAAAQPPAGAPPFAPKSAKGKAKKSFADALTETSEAVSKAIDISDYLRDFVAAVSESHEQLSSRVEKSLRSQASQGEFNVALAVAMQQMGGLIKGLSDKLDTFGTKPSGQRKSDVSVVEKSFAGEGEGSTLSKSDISAKLTTLMESGDKSVTVADVLSADASGFVRPELREKVGLPKA